MSVYRSFLRPLLFATSSGNPERAHRWAIDALKFTQENAALLKMLEKLQRIDVPDQSIDLLGMHFPNRVGVAAGFDKNAEVLPALQASGVGFSEAGTFTLKPQDGNPGVRIKRLIKEEGLMNFMGFPSYGYREVRDNIEAYAPYQKIPLGINIGKNAKTPAVDAADEYAELTGKICKRGDYLAINVSSPNTKGLTRLQEPEYLESLVHGVVVADACARARLGLPPRPVFVKISIDLTDEALLQVVRIILEAGARGIIIGNTSAHFRPQSLRDRDPRTAALSWGYSGPQNFDRCIEMIKLVAALKTELVIIGVSGINSGARAREMISAGAHLIQLYTGLIYEGLKLIRECRIALAS